MRLWLGVICGLALAGPALASAQTRVVVGSFSGPSGKQARSAVEKVLEAHGIEIVSWHKAASTARSSGAELDSESGRVRVGKKLHLRAFIEGRTHAGARRRMDVSIHLYSATDGMSVAEFKGSPSKTGVGRDIEARLWAAISSALGGGAAPSQPAPEVAAAPERPSRASPPQRVAPEAVAREAEEEEEPKPMRRRAADDERVSLAEHADQEEPSTDKPSPFDIGIGGRFGSRFFGYHDSLMGLRPYDLYMSPSVTLRAHWYPAAHASAGVLANIGLDLRGELLFGVTSENKKTKQKFSTSSHTLGIGLRGRIPFSRFELGLVAGYGQHTFAFANLGRVDPDLPDVSYSFIRAGLDARWQFMDPWALQLAAAYLVGLSQGEIATKPWFPHAQGNGVEAEIGASYALSRAFSLEVWLAMQRYFMSLNPDPKDPGVVGAGRVAGGALDQYFSLRVALALRL